jgi:hypothetical protein
MSGRSRVILTGLGISAAGIIALAPTNSVRAAESDCGGYDGPVCENTAKCNQYVNGVCVDVIFTWTYYP